MSVPSRVDRCLEKGSYGTVEYAVRAKGTLEAKDWLTNQKKSVQTKFGVLFRHLVQQGQIRNTERFKKLDDQVYEFKVHEGSGYRLYCFQQGSRWLLTHGSPKKKKKQVQAEIEHTKTVSDEHVEYEAKENKKRKRK